VLNQAVSAARTLSWRVAKGIELFSIDTEMLSRARVTALR
jgi:hypothetical protein